MNRAFTYDAENRQRTATIGANAQKTTYDYDGNGRRVQTTVASLWTTVFVYDAGGQLAAEYSTAPSTDSGVSYLTADHLGSTRLVTGAGGVVKKCYDYLPFGEEIPSGFAGRSGCYGSGTYPMSSPDIISEKFTDKERDAETGLDFFGARYISGAQGRFTSPDPDNYDARLEQPQSWNMYAYTWNNPLKYKDNDGRTVALAIIGAGVGFVTNFTGSAISQEIRNGTVDWGTAAKVGGIGAATGSLAGLTLGTSLVAQAFSSVAIGTLGNVANGAASRLVAGGEAFDPSELESDFKTGVISSSLGAGVQFLGTVANLPIKPKLPSPLGTVQKQLQRIAGLRFWQQQRDQVSHRFSAGGAVVSSLISNAGAQVVSAWENKQNYLSSLWFELMLGRQQQNGTTSTICYAGEPGCAATSEREP